MNVNAKLKMFVLLLFMGVNVHAIDLDVSGFGTAAGGIVEQEDIQIMKYDDSISFDSDSMLAVQIDAQVTSKLSLTVQTVARAIENYDLEVEWAYINYQWDGDTEFKLGEVRLPLYYYSDQLEVGYAYHWIRPPDEVYSIPVTTFDGLRVDYRWGEGDWDHSFNFYGGDYRHDTVVVSSELKNSPQLEIDSRAEKIIGLAYQLDTGALTLRTSFFDLEVDFGSDGRTAVEQQLIGAGYPDVADDLFINGKYLRFFTFYSSYRWYKSFVAVEVAYQDFERSNVADRKGFYLTTGHNLTPKLLLHYTYSTLETDPETSISDPIPSSDPLKAKVDSIVAAGLWEQTTHTFGLRYSLQEYNIALKAEYQRMKDDLPDGDRADLYLFAADFVF